MLELEIIVHIRNERDAPRPWLLRTIRLREISCAYIIHFELISEFMIMA